MNSVFWMDDPLGINPKKDSTYLLIHACFNHHITPYYMMAITIDGEHLRVTVAPFKNTDLGDPLQLGTPLQLTDTDCDVIWLRKDPPVDDAYRRDLLLLNEFATKVHLLNDPKGILLNNEKLAARQFVSLTPPTLITSKKADIYAFLQTHGTAIVKPLDGFGGQGIFKLTRSDTNCDTIIDQCTHQERVPIICQKAVDHTTGDKRVILMDGVPLGCVKRINYHGHRNNFMAGGVAEPATLTPRDHHIIDTIRPFIQSNGLFFVGIDIIDGYLIEINVTSPTGLHEINRLDSVSLHDTIIREMMLKVTQAC